MRLHTTLAPAILVSMAVIACHRGGNETGGTTNSIGVYTDTLSYETAQRYVHNYSKRAEKFIRVHAHQTDTLNDTREIWFSIDTLKSLVQQVVDSGGDGIRFYLAAYDSIYPGYNSSRNKEHLPDTPYWHHSTLVMVSTFDSIGHHWDYYGGSPTIAARKGKGFIVGVIQNNGELCPPPANCNQIGATLLNP